MLKPSVKPGRPSLLWVIFATTFAAAGCGDSTSPAPEITDLRVACAQSSDVGGLALESISVRVTDPDRDLISVEGTLNGAPMTLTDDDADQRFSWTPPGNADPVACSGEFAISIDATDQAGHTSHFDQIYQN